MSGAPKDSQAFGFGTPFQEQIDYLVQKLNLPTDRWDDIQGRANDKAFIVAGASKADLVEDFHQALIKAATGGSMQEFRQDFKATVARNGWTGWTGEGSKAGEAWRTRIIYQTNMSTSYWAGRYQQMTDPEFLKLHPYWRYIHDESVLHPRPMHLSWHGITLPADHPFFLTHFAPNGWLCHCRITSVTRKEGEASARAGLGEPPAGWDKIDPKTGAQVGIDKGFDYAPGASVKKSFQSLIDDKLIKLDAPIGAAMWESLKPVLLAERSAAYREWLASLASGERAKSLMPIIGAIDPQDLKWLQANGNPLPKTAEIAISSGPINGPKAVRHERDGNALPQQAWENLPELLAEPLAVLYDNNKNTFLYILPEMSAKRPQLVVEFDFQRKDQRNMVISGYRPLLQNLLNRVANGTVSIVRGVLE